MVIEGAELLNTNLESNLDFDTGIPVFGTEKYRFSGSGNTGQEVDVNMSSVWLLGVLISNLDSNLVLELPIFAYRIQP